MTSTDLVTARLTRALAAVGGADVVLGAVLAQRGRTPAQRAFGQQTAAWGAIDLGIAALAALASSRRKAAPTAARLRTILLVNAGLDVLYMAGGGHLAAHRSSLGGRLEPEVARGYGVAVVVQGAVLLALDLSHAQALTPSGRSGRSGS
jgi:hypothetical protein